MSDRFLLCIQTDVNNTKTVFPLYYYVCHAAPISIEDPNVIDDNTLVLTWLTPPSVTSQGVEQYTIDVSPRCLTGENAVNAQQFVRSPIQAPSVMVSNLRKWCTIDVPHYFTS